MSVHFLKRISILTRASPHGRLLSTGHSCTQSDACKFLLGFTNANIEHCLHKLEWRDDFGEAGGGSVVYKVPSKVRHFGARNSGSFSRFFGKEAPPVAICCEKSRHRGKDRYVCVPVNFEKLSAYARNAAIKAKKRRQGTGTENFQKFIAMGQKEPEDKPVERPEVLRYSVGTGKFTAELLMTKAPVPANKVITDNFVDKRHFVSDGSLKPFDFGCSLSNKSTVGIGAMFSQQCGVPPDDKGKKSKKGGPGKAKQNSVAQSGAAQRSIAEQLKKPVAMACEMIRLAKAPKGSKEVKQSGIDSGGKISSPVKTVAPVTTRADKSPAQTNKSPVQKEPEVWESSTYSGRKPFKPTCDPCKSQSPCRRAPTGPKWVPPMPPASPPAECAPAPPRCTPVPPKCEPSPPKAVCSPPTTVPPTPPTGAPSQEAPKCTPPQPSKCTPPELPKCAPPEPQKCTPPEPTKCTPPEPPKCTPPQPPKCTPPELLKCTPSQPPKCTPPPCHPPPPEAKACLCQSCSKTATTRAETKCASELENDCKPETTSPPPPPNPEATAGRHEGCQLSLQQLEYERIKESTEVPQLKVSETPRDQCAEVKAQPCGPTLATSAAKDQTCSAPTPTPCSTTPTSQPKAQPCGGAPSAQDNLCATQGQPAKQPCGAPQEKPAATCQKPLIKDSAQVQSKPTAQAKPSSDGAKRCGTGCALQGVSSPNQGGPCASAPPSSKPLSFEQSASQCVADFLKKFKAECEAKPDPCPKEEKFSSTCPADKKKEEPICTICLTLPIGDFVCTPKDPSNTKDPCGQGKKDPCKTAASSCGAPSANPCAPKEKDPCKSSGTDPRKAADLCGSTKNDPCKSSQADPCAPKEKDLCKPSGADPCKAQMKDTCGATKKDPCKSSGADPCKAADPCGSNKNDSCKSSQADPCKALMADPCGATKKDPCGSTGQVDPCKAQQCSISADPCGLAKKDPCQASVDPCKTKVDDPCKTPKDDPCKTSKDDPCKSAKSDPCKSAKATKDDPCKTPKDDPCKTPKDDPCKSAKSDPCKSAKAASKPDPCSPAKADPCASSKPDPCKFKDDPCKPKTDPCSSSSKDPCKVEAASSICQEKAKADPCASSKPDPCKNDPCKPKTDPCSSGSKDPCKVEAACAVAQEKAKADSCKAQTADPCGAAKKDPYKAKASADPCVLKGKADPCKANPSVDPCASTKKDSKRGAIAGPSEPKVDDPCKSSKPDPCKFADPCSSTKADQSAATKSDPCKVDSCKAKADSSSSASKDPCKVSSDSSSGAKEKVKFDPCAHADKKKDEKTDAKGGDKKSPCDFLKKVDLDAPAKTGPDCAVKKGEQKEVGKAKAAEAPKKNVAKAKEAAAPKKDVVEANEAAAPKKDATKTKEAAAPKKDVAEAKDTKSVDKATADKDFALEPRKCFNLETCSATDGKLTCVLSQKSTDSSKADMDKLMCAKSDFPRVERGKRLEEEGEVVRGRNDCVKAKTYENVMADRLNRVADYLLKKGTGKKDDDDSDGGCGGGGGASQAPEQKDPGAKPEQRDPRCKAGVGEPKKNCDPKLDPKDRMVAAVEEPPLRRLAKICADDEEERKRRKARQGPYCDPLTGKEPPEEPVKVTRKEETFVHLRNRRFDSYKQLDSSLQAQKKPVTCIAGSCSQTKKVVPKPRKRVNVGPQAPPPPIEVPCQMRQLAKNDCEEAKEAIRFARKAEVPPPKIQLGCAVAKPEETTARCADKKEERAPKPANEICPTDKPQDRVAPRTSVPLRKEDEDGYIRSRSNYVHPSRMPPKPPRKIPVERKKSKGGLLEGARGLYRNIVDALMPGKEGGGPKKCHQLPPPPLTELRITGSLCLNNSSFDDDNMGRRRSSEQWRFSRSLRE